MFEVGDFVVWESQARGTMLRKQGRVEAIVPAFQTPARYIPPDTPGYRIRCNRNGVSKVTRYIVSVSHGSPYSKNLNLFYYVPDTRQLARATIQRHLPCL